MSKVKNSSVYERHFQEVLREDNNSYELYLEELYLQQRKTNGQSAHKPLDKSKNPNHNEYGTGIRKGE